MAIKVYKPTSPGRRNMTTLDYSHLSKAKPFKKLLKTKTNHAGRNNTGKITVRHREAGHKKFYRVIDFKRDKDNIPAKVQTIEYDPNRNAFIALVAYQDGEKRYIIQPRGLKVGDTIMSGSDAPFKPGNTLALADIPDGTQIHNIEMRPHYGAQLVRAAGTWAQLVSKEAEGKYALVKMSSGEVRKILKTCRATIGIVGNEDYNLVNWGKAGRNRWKGKRPTVRGSAMNPNAHPHGGGEGKAPIGRKAPMTPWGKKALGVKTRNKKKPSTKLIIKRKGAKR